MFLDQEHEYADPLHTSNYFNDKTLIAEEEVDMPNNIRRSLSVGNLDLDKLENFCKLRSGRVYRKSDENLTRLAQPKRNYGSEQNLSRNEYVPMAEAVNRFQHGTPKRFRSRPNLLGEPSQLTIPHSPKLITSIRGRPVPDYVLSQNQKEQLEFEEAKKSQFKANPMNKNIFKTPVVYNAKVKKSTIPEPFKLTAPPKKIGPSPVKKVPEFHAKPVPKYLLEPQIPTNKAPLRIHVTKPHTPSFMRHRSHSPKRTPQNKNETLQPQQNKLKSTRPVPFSFETRDKHIMSKKDQLIQKVLEAEKKAREFHAKPIPKSILQPTRAFSMATKNKADDTVNTTIFKAKPPTVLYKKPFEPKREDRPLLEIEHFVLNTDVRFREREHFDQMIKFKEKQLLRLREEEELKRRRKEADEIQRARKNAEFKAQEIKKYKEMVIKPSMKLTQPISPKLSNKTKNRSANKENTP
ncbi:unnamed protein product [Psylliodes chrysocephalus]|uniref:Targeting protein for Xklp2 n=1 Tax=Psylliodes chrysocephalus TaxID=3402493 RepID=A0A9P0CGT9_9CUCU|nr:unnamed protein product [Psylliodes chrysocephala]